MSQHKCRQSILHIVAEGLVLHHNCVQPASSSPLPYGLPMSDIQVSTCVVSAYYCIVTRTGMQEASEADTASMDEEQAAQEEVERLDSGTTSNMSHGFAWCTSQHTAYVAAALHVGAGLSSLQVHFDCCVKADVRLCRES